MKAQQVQLDDRTLLIVEVEEFDEAEEKKQQLNTQKFQELWDWMDAAGQEHDEASLQ